MNKFLSTVILVLVAVGLFITVVSDKNSLKYSQQHLRQTIVEQTEETKIP